MHVGINLWILKIVLNRSCQALRKARRVFIFVLLFGLTGLTSEGWEFVDLGGHIGLRYRCGKYRDLLAEPKFAARER